MTLRFRQSYAKTLLNDCPGQLRYDLQHGRVPSTAMARGSVVDQMVFGGAKYHVIGATYKSGPRKGMPVDSWTPEAKAERDALADGRPCVFACDEQRLKQAAVVVRAELLRRGIDLDAPEVVTQEHVTWTSRDGVSCEGTPDIVVRDKGVTVDLKYGEECSPQALRRLIWNMCWDVQGAAYQEAYGFLNGTHCIARATDSCFVMVTLSSLALSMGRHRLDYARGIWRECMARDEWPWWQDCTVDPPEYEMSRWLARANQPRQDES